jgi:hypothetical protein
VARAKRKDAPEDATAATAVRVVAHPRARTSIRRWRGRAGLLGLIAVAWLSLRAGVPASDAVLRGLAGGVAAQFVAWAAGVVVWRHLILAELVAHREARIARTDVQRREKSLQVP